MTPKALMTRIKAMKKGKINRLRDLFSVAMTGLVFMGGIEK